MDENMQKTPEEMLDIRSNKVQAVLAYLGVLVLIPIFAAKDSKFARFHANQGLVLVIFEIAIGIVTRILGVVFRAHDTLLGYTLPTYHIPFWVTSISGLFSLAVLVFAILGIVNACNGEEKELPIIGTIKILK